ncbi:MAG: hypothetical protein KatS3mg081_0049 [Gemmatimonadales bacterium]|nr:MAG: hypothetical protein KatS3mg081_0049 [Gemmatimonadales bacterium]
MAKATKKSTVTRLNIYLPDPAIRRQVKAAAAKQDLSASEYCLRAITRQLIRDGERPPHGKERPPLETAIAAARRFQAETFGGRVFTVSSAELIREAREGRMTR